MLIPIHCLRLLALHRRSRARLTLITSLHWHCLRLLILRRS